MARANTFEMDKGGYSWDKRGCIICGEKEVNYRAFFYPTYMNGDAEWLGDYCKEHKGTNLQNICKGKIAIRYALPDYPNLKTTHEN